MSKWCCCGSHRRDASSKDADTSAETPVQLPGPNKTSASQQHQTNSAERRADGQRPAKPVRVDPTSVPLGIPAEIEALIVEDSKSEDSKPSLPRKASIVFSIVRSKLSRHAPAEHDEKKQSHISVRNSEEEIARRAELRRLRHRRIQDELHHDISGDDASNISPNSLRQPHSLTSLYQACIGPRDVLEFTVPDRIKDAIDSNSPTSSIKLGSLPKVRQGDHKRDLDSKQKRLGSKEHTGEEHLWPVHLRQDHPSSSNTGPRLTETISRKSLPTKSTTFVERDLSVRADSYLKEDDQSTLGVWLIAQAMQSEDAAGNCAESDHTVVHNDTANQDSTQSDKECPEESRRRLSRTSTSSSDPPERRPSSPLPSPPSPPPGEPAADNVATREDDSESDILQFFPIFAKSLLEEPPEIALTPPPSKPVPDSSSSRYNSHRPSILPSPSRSQLNVHNLSLRDLRNLDLSPFQWDPNSSFAPGVSRSEGQSSYATAEDRQSGHETDVDVAPVAWRSSPLPADASSASQSETPSFRKREAELQTIQARFGDVLSRKKLPATFQSRFKEEFSDSEPSENQQSSLLSKIHGKSPRSAAKRSKRSNLLGDWSVGSLEYSDENKAAIPSESKRHSRATLRPNDDAGLGKPTSESSRTIAEKHIPWWEKVIKPDESKKRNSRANAVRLSLPRHISSPPSQNGALSSNHLTDSTQILSGPEPAVPVVAEPLAQIGRHRQAITPRIDESSTGIPSTRLNRNLSNQPSLWASYPLHLFEERNGSASIKDQVTAQDFATSAITANAASGQVSKQVTSTDTNNDAADKLALQERLVRVFRTSLSKLVPLMDSNRHATERPASDLSTTTKGSVPKGDLTEGNIDESLKSGLADKVGGHLPTTSATTKPLAYDDCTPKLLDIAHRVAGVSGSATKPLGPIESSSEPVLPRLGAASIRNVSAQTKREGGLVMPGLRLMMSDHSLQHSLRGSAAPGESAKRRSMASPSQRQLSDGELAVS